MRWRVQRNRFVLTVPMRNGNLISDEWILKVFCSSYRTYEEWKRKDTIATALEQIGSYRTYEEWKPLNSLSVTLPTWVLTVPMRNGNKEMESLKVKPAVGSYRTYEEWKLLISSSTSILAVIRSYRTYEEWKPKLR